MELTKPGAWTCESPVPGGRRSTKAKYPSSSWAAAGVAWIRSASAKAARPTIAKRRARYMRGVGRKCAWGDDPSDTRTGYMEPARRARWCCPHFPPRGDDLTLPGGTIALEPCATTCHDG